MNYSELWKRIKPYAIPDMRAIGTAGGTNTSTGGVATMEAHELASSSGLGTYHTVTGLTAGQVIVATGATAARFAALTHSQLTGVSADQHHAQAHSITGGDHTYSGGAALDVFGLSGASTIAKLTPSSNPGAAAALLRSDSAGGLTVEQLAATNYVRTSTLNTASGNLSITPAGDLIITPGGGDVFLSDAKTLRTNTFSSGFAGSGFRMDQGVATAGRTTLELDDLWVRGRMHVYELLLHQIRATNGSILVANTGKITTRSLYSGTEGAVGSQYTLNTDVDQPHGFAVGDLIWAKRWDGLSVYDSKLEVIGVYSTYNFRAQLVSGAAPQVGYEYVRIGSTSDANRRGGVYLTADDSGAPFIDVWNGIDAFSDWNTAGVIKVRLGRLDGLTGGTNEYGLWAAGANAGDHLLVSPTSGFELVAGNGVISIDETDGISLVTTTSADWFRTYSFKNPSGSYAGLRGFYETSPAINYAIVYATSTGNKAPRTMLWSEGNATYDGSIQLLADGSNNVSILMDSNVGTLSMTGTVGITGTLAVSGGAQFDSAVAVGSAADDISRFKTTGSNTVADNGTLTIGAQFTGLAFIFCPSDASVAIYAIDQGGTTYEIADPENLYTPTAGSASSTNLYISGGNLILQNKRGSSRVYHIMLFGTSGAF